MKKLIQSYCFWYGCLGTLCAFAWYIAAILGFPTMPTSVWVAEAVFALHGCAALATFHRTTMRPAWQPVLSVTAGRIALARSLFGLSIVNFLVCFGLFLVAEIRGNVALGNEGAALILTSFLLLNTIYIAIHWAFRPENLFSASFLRLISNPLELLSRGNKPQ
jgi:hypothetical protein